MRAWPRLLCLVVAAQALAAPAAAQFQKNEYQYQQEHAQKLEPAPLRMPQRVGGGPPITLRLRFYADSEYRAAALHWQEHVKVTLASLNNLVEPAFGVRFEAEGFKRWERQAPGGDLGALARELERLDPGADVDWVVGLVAPLPLVTMSLHQLGLARVLGRHFVLRGMASIEELDGITQALNLLEPGERAGLYSRRKEHKELSLFLHEWAHTLGAMHVEDPTRLMCPNYSTRMSLFSESDARVIGAALEGRLNSRGRDAVDWAPLRGLLHEVDDPGWMRPDRQELLRLLGNAPAPTGSAGAAPPAGGSKGPTPARPAAAELPASATAYDRAVALINKGKEDEAWEALAPYVRQGNPPSHVLHLLCRLSHLPAAGATGHAACQAAIVEAPDDPDARLDLAQALILEGKGGDALSALREAEARVAKRARPNDEGWVALAMVHRRLGTLAEADEALRRAGEAKGAEAERAALLRTRRLFGLPAAAKPAPAADDEIAYAEAWRKGNDLLSANKAKEARPIVDAALRRFPQAPGMQTLSCEVALRSGQAAAAAKACAAALAKLEEQPRAHFLMAHVKIAQGNPNAAIKPLKRAIELDPQEKVFWETLAELYRGLGRRKELNALTIDQAAALGAAK